jgi:hypothetical protein
MLEELEAASAAQKRREKEVKAWSRRWMKSDWEKSEEEIRTLLNVKAKSFLQQDNVLSMMEDPQIVYIEKPYHYEVEEVSELDSERIYVNLAVKAELNIEGFLFKSDYYLLDDKSPFSIWDDDWNKHYMFVSTEVKAILVLSFILKSKTKDVDQIEAEFAESFGWCRHCGNRS